MSKNKNQNLNWDDFIKLGNPENAPEPEVEKIETDMDYSQMKIRIYLDRKRRAGKSVTLISGLKHNNNQIKEFATQLKKTCGVGGSGKNGEIILQGDHRDKVLKILQNLGATDVKKAGG